MPFLIINLGAEMLYILQQRLRAQSIEEARTKRILGVVLASLLQPSFVEELFRPREAYSVRATRIVFERIAHASVMRLNKQSMDKLYKQLNDIYSDVHPILDDNGVAIQCKKNIEDKYNRFTSENKLQKVVGDFLTDIYKENKDIALKIMKDTVENNDNDIVNGF
jgi:hypothetical protein